jgi:hypothetical protein
MLLRSKRAALDARLAPQTGSKMACTARVAERLLLRELER